MTASPTRRPDTAPAEPAAPAPDGAAATAAGGSTSSRFAAFDGLRALAVLATFGAHTVSQTLKGSWIGVEAFFALSGFLITSLLLREHARTGGVDLKAFYIRRALRLTPALVAMVVVVTPLAVLAALPDAIPQAIATITYTADFYLPLAHHHGEQFLGHAWSLGVEEQFYLIWPALLVLGIGSRRRLLRTAAVLALAAQIGSAAVAVVLGPFVAYGLPLQHIPTLLLGAMLAFAADAGRPWVRRLAAGWVPVTACVVALVVSLTASLDQMWLYWGGQAVVGAVLVAFVGHLYAAPQAWAARVLSIRPLVWLGERSYGFYLWHMPVLFLLPVSALGKVPSMVLAFATTLAVTVLSWQLVEKPFLRLKDRFVRVSGSAAQLTVQSDPVTR